MKTSTYAVLGGVFLISSFFTSCGAVSSYEQHLGSMKGVVAERHFPAEVDLFVALDTRDAISVTKTLELLQPYFPNELGEGATLNTLRKDYEIYLQEELGLDDEIFADLMAVLPTENRLAFGIEFSYNAEADTAQTAHETEAYFSFLVENTERLQVLHQKLLALPGSSERTYKGVTYLAMEDADTTPVYGYLQDDVMFVTSTEAGIRRMLDAREKKELSLLATPYVKDVEYLATKPTLLSGFMNYREIISLDFYRDLYTGMGYTEEEVEEQLASLEKTFAVMQMPDYVWGQLYTSERGIESDVLAATSEGVYTSLGLSMSDLLHSGTPLGAKITEGHVLMAQEYRHFATIVGGLLPALMPTEYTSEVASQMTFVKNLIQYHTGLNWNEEIVPFLNLPTWWSLVDTGDILPEYVMIVDTKEHAALGERVVTQLVSSLDKGIAFLDMQFAETELPLPSTLYSKETIPGGYRVRYQLAPYYQDELGAIGNQLSGQALALLRSLALVMELKQIDGAVHMTVALDASSTTLGKDPVFSRFVESFAQRENTQLAYVGITALATYAERVYGVFAASGVWEIKEAQQAEALDAQDVEIIEGLADGISPATVLNENKFTRAEGEAVFEQILAGMRLFSSMEMWGKVKDDRLMESHLLIPFSR